jgi:hypothetical protein
MKRYIISNLILAPFVFASYTYQNSPIIGTIILTIGFIVCIGYLLKEVMFSK